MDTTCYESELGYPTDQKFLWESVDWIYRQLKQLKNAITKESASRLEGSFGKEKAHYHLRKIKARTKANETLWIFFGIHTANTLEIGKRMHRLEQ